MTTKDTSFSGREEEIDAYVNSAVEDVHFNRQWLKAHIKAFLKETITPQSREQSTGGDVCAICGRTEGDHSYGSHSHGFVKKHQTNQ